MSTGEHASTLEHLAEMDRLLRGIQTELAPDREPAPALEVPPRPPPPTAPPPGDPPPSAPPPGDPPPGDPPPGDPPPGAPPTPIHDAPDSGASQPEAEPPGPDPPPPPRRSEPSGGGDQLQALSRLAARLLASMRELLDGYEQFLVHIPSAENPAPARRRADATVRPAVGASGEQPDVTVAAGPFASVEALRGFEQAVSRLSGVRDVAIRGYEGADRAIIEVRLERT